MRLLKAKCLNDSPSGNKVTPTDEDNYKRRTVTLLQKAFIYSTPYPAGGAITSCLP
jgi:hypothetical protein